MLKSPVINPLLVLIVYRALLRSSSPLSLERGWLACPGWMPSDERQAETSPLECLSGLPSFAHKQLEASLSSEMFQVASNQTKSSLSHLSPSCIARVLYEKAPGEVCFSAFPDLSSPTPQAMGKTWKETGLDASWVIRSRPEISAWIELGPEDVIDDALPVFCLRMGAGLWFHPPTRKPSKLDGCRGLISICDAMLDTEGWDQWVFPLSEALEFSIAKRLAAGGDLEWLSVPRANKWPDLPDWAWRRADHLYGGSFGILVAAIASRLVADGLGKKI